MTDTPRHKYVAPAHFCAACRKRGKTWNGSDPECAFQHGKPFSHDNWSCETAGKIRDLCGDWWDEKRPEGIQMECADDQTYCTILTHDVDFPGNAHAWCLWITWYKSRGRTEAMWLLGEGEDGPPRPPTEAEALAIIDYYTRASMPRPPNPEMEEIRRQFMAAAVEVEPGVHMLEFGGNDDDIPF